MPNRVQLLVLDVDGVLTDGSIFLDAEGREIKRFCAADGVALRTWQRLGKSTAVITGRSSPAVQHRAADLGIQTVIQGSKDKSRSLDELIERTGVAAADMAYVADDWPDLPAFRRVGYPIAVANADPLIKRLAKFTTRRSGGDGAVREAVEHLLTAMDLMGKAVALYDAPHGKA